MGTNRGDFKCHARGVLLRGKGEEFRNGESRYGGRDPERPFHDDHFYLTPETEEVTQGWPISLRSQSEDVRAIHSHLANCLMEIRKETERQKAAMARVLIAQIDRVSSAGGAA